MRYAKENLWLLEIFKKKNIKRTAFFNRTITTFCPLIKQKFSYEWEFWCSRTFSRPNFWGKFETNFVPFFSKLDRSFTDRTFHVYGNMQLNYVHYQKVNMIKMVFHLNLLPPHYSVAHSIRILYRKDLNRLSWQIEPDNVYLQK